jgi:hypothetical protein
MTRVLWPSSWWLALSVCSQWSWGGADLFLHRRGGWLHGRDMRRGHGNVIELNAKHIAQINVLQNVLTLALGLPNNVCACLSAFE